MRASLLVALVACSGTGTTAQRPATTPASVHARITNDADGSWIDISAFGDQASALCDQLVARTLQVNGRLARPCTPAALPPTPQPSGAVLIEVDQPDAASRIATYRPYPDRTSCDRARTQLFADDKRRREDGERARVLDLESRIRAATDARDAACGAVAEDDARCATRKGDERTQCNLATEPKRMACRDATRRRDELDRPPAPLAPLPDRACR
jgi:hypothetical protein